MRSLRLLIPMLLIAAIALVGASSSAFARAPGLIGAQEEGGEEQGGGAGQDDPEAETGANEGQTEEVAEEGPPWTYQMAWITMALLVFLAIGLVSLYYRLVAQRRKGEV